MVRTFLQAPCNHVKDLQRFTKITPSIQFYIQMHKIIFSTRRSS